MQISTEETQYIEFKFFDYIMNTESWVHHAIKNTLNLKNEVTRTFMRTNIDHKFKIIHPSAIGLTPIDDNWKKWKNLLRETIMEGLKHEGEIKLYLMSLLCRENECIDSKQPDNGRLKYRDAFIDEIQTFLVPMVINDIKNHFR